MFEILDLSPELAAALGDAATIDHVLNLSGQVFRQFANRKTLRFEAGGRQYFLKIHGGVGWKEIFKNLFQGKWPVLGAENEYRAIKRLHELNVGTMTLAGYGQRGHNPARLDSFVITEALPCSVSLEEFCEGWANQPPNPVLKRSLIQRIAWIAKTLHENGVNHRDFYLCHFMLRLPADLEDGLHLYLIDLHRAQIRCKTPNRWIVKDLAGLYFSALDVGLTSRDLFRFLTIYSGQSLRSVLSEKAGTWRQVHRKAHKLYARHAV